MKEIPCKPVDAINDAGLLSEIRKYEGQYRFRSIIIELVNLLFFAILFFIPVSVIFLYGLPIIKEDFDVQLRSFFLRLFGGGLSDSLTDFLGSLFFGTVEIAFFCIAILFIFGLASWLWKSARTLFHKHPIVAENLIITDNVDEARGLLLSSLAGYIKKLLEASWNGIFSRTKKADFDQDFYDRHRDGVVMAITSSMKIPFTSECNNKAGRPHGGNEIKVEFKEAGEQSVLFVFKVAACANARGLPVVIAIFDTEYLEEIKRKITSLCPYSLRS
ncbi:MAG: hypothetical protein ABIH29_05510 [Candidatus Micrarchaeota archaeon]